MSPPTTTSGTVPASDGVPLAWTRHAPPPDAEPRHTFVLVHGWSGSARYFDAVAGGLAARGSAVLTIDLRFHGASGPLPRPPAPTGVTPPGAHVARLAVDLDNVLAALDVTDAVAVGTSMGASILWCYGELYGRGRVARVVCVDQAPLQNRTPGWTSGSKGCYDAATLAGLQAAVRGDVEAFAAGNAAACLARPVDQATLALLASETARACRDALAALMADHTQLDWRPAVCVCPHETLVVVGGRSAIFPPDGCAWVARAAPAGQLVSFEDCGHWLYIERGDEFVDVVWRWAEGERVDGEVVGGK